MDQLAKGLDASDHAWYHVLAFEDVPVDLGHAFPTGASELTEQAAVKAKVNAEPFGNGNNQLPMGHGGADHVRDRVGGQQRAFLMTTGTQTTLVTGERDEHLVGAVAAADAGKTKVQIPAVEELARHFADDGPPIAIAPLVTVVVSALKFEQVLLDDLAQRRLPRPSRTVDRCDLGRQTDQGDARFPFDKGRVTREPMFELNE